MAIGGGIYKIVNTINGRLYVGSSISFNDRFSSHIRELNKGTHKNRYLQRAWKKYGASSFEFEILESISDNSLLIEREQYHIDNYKVTSKLYNLAMIAGSNLGTKRTKEFSDKISKANTGKIRTDEQRLNISLAKKKLYLENPELKSELVQRLRKASLLIDRNKQKQSASISAKNRVWSEESRSKLSKSCMGRVYGDEVIDRMRETKKKKVECTTLNTIFDSISEAATNLGFSISGISKVCLGKRKKIYGLEFNFI